MTEEPRDVSLRGQKEKGDLEAKTNPNVTGAASILPSITASRNTCGGLLH